jgi:hypothetical protein
MTRPPWEVADIIRRAGSRFIERYRVSLTWAQLKVLRAIERCRTAALGGHRDQCVRCGHPAISYNSCLMGSISFWGVPWRTGVQPVTTRRFDSPLRFGFQQGDQFICWPKSAFAEVRRDHSLNGLQLLAGIGSNVYLRGC